MTCKACGGKLYQPLMGPPECLDRCSEKVRIVVTYDERGLTVTPVYPKANDPAPLPAQVRLCGCTGCDRMAAWGWGHSRNIAGACPFVAAGVSFDDQPAVNEDR